MKETPPDGNSKRMVNLPEPEAPASAMTRRRLLIGLLGSAGLLLSVSTYFRRAILGAVQRVVGTPIPADQAVGALKPEVLRTLGALGDVLVPSRSSSEGYSPGEGERSGSPPESVRHTENPVPATRAALQRGRVVFEQNCSDCHGASGRPPEAFAGLPDLSDASRTHSQTDGELFWTISKGRGSMPGYESSLPEEDRWRVVHYVRQLGTVTSDDVAAAATRPAPEPESPYEAIQLALQDWAAHVPGYLTEFTSASRLLDSRSLARHQRSFADLTIHERRRLVADLLHPYTSGSLSRALSQLSEDGRQLRRLWRFVCVPVLTAFYTSSFGWNVVGYPRRRGEGSNLIDYQFPVR